MKKFLSNQLQNLKKIRACGFYRKNTPESTKKFLKFAEFIYSHEMKKRKIFFNNQYEKELEEFGFTIKNLSHFDKNNIVQHFRAEYDKINWDLDNNQFKKNYLHIKFLEFSPSVIELASLFLDLATNYIGSLPILNSAQFWYSPNLSDEKIGSQNFHMDPEDYKQLKIYIPIEKITTENGPVTFLNSKDSYKIYNDLILKKRIKNRSSKVDDNTIYSYSSSSPKSGILNTDQFLALDTCRCWHYGSRKSKLPRKVLFLQFTSAFGSKCPFIFRSPKKTKFLKKDNQLLIFGYQEKMINHFKKLKYINVDKNS